MTLPLPVRGGEQLPRSLYCLSSERESTGGCQVLLCHLINEAQWRPRLRVPRCRALSKEPHIPTGPSTGSDAGSLHRIGDPATQGAVPPEFGAPGRWQGAYRHGPGRRCHRPASPAGSGMDLISAEPPHRGRGTHLFWGKSRPARRRTHAEPDSSPRRPRGLLRGTWCSGRPPKSVSARGRAGSRPRSDGPQSG